MATIAPIPMKYRAEDRRYPIGWYGVAESEEVGPDTLLPVAWLGQQMVVYRTAEGKAQVAYAYCPHLGAHLASADGSVCGGKLTCPFHKWQFDGATGAVTHIPYTQVMVPSSVRLTLYPTREIDGVIVIWYHPEGGEPQFEPFDSSPLLGDDKWRLYTTHSWETTCPFRDILENLFDTAHIVQLHNATALPEIKAFEPKPYGLRVDYETDANSGEATPLKRFECNFSGVTLLSQYYEGGGYTALFTFTFTPIDEERFIQKTRLYLKDEGPKEALEAIGKAFADRFIYEVDQDMRVLNYKKHLTSPRLCAGDGPIMKFRRYAENYYQ
ncbi:Rieske 2Fe-2S domain-containing protein [Sphingobium aromaticivastans]|uniref:Rieske 2Fe-2S domain-containing protein n=1 Tax=Sphingobium aromaticivastans TaxID=1778665 RepID=UPI0030174E20